MADVWVSLNGHDEGATGEMQNPYRTLTYAMSRNNSNGTRFILSNAGGDPTSLFEELEIVVINKQGITIYSESLGTVFVKCPKVVLDRSNVSLHGVVFEPTDDSSHPNFISVLSSTLNTINFKMQEVKLTGIYASNSSLSFANTTIEGSDEAAVCLSASGNTSITYVGGLTMQGTYGTGIVCNQINKFDGTGLRFNGEFSNGLMLDMTGVTAPQVSISDTVINNVYSDLIGVGLSLSGVKNSAQVVSIFQLLVHHATTAIQTVDSEIEFDKITIDSCTNGIIATEASGIMISNSSITNCGLALKPESASIIEYKYTNLFNNSLDFESDYSKMSPPEQFRVYLAHPVAYELIAGNIKPGSEIVTAADQPGLMFMRNTDYIIEYGSEFELGKISRIETGNIPSGQLLNITYEYKNFNVITGTVVPGVRVRHIDPRFSNVAAFNYSLADDSPLIEAGVYTGRGFIGTAPDLGYYERTRALSASETVLQLNLRSASDTVLLEPDVANTILLQVENIKAYEPGIDVSEGSTVRDLLIKPAGHLLDGPRVEREYLMNQQSILNYATMSKSELDLLAGNYFIERKPGQFATGTVRIYLSRPVDITVPAATEFKSGGATFVAVRDQIFIMDEVMFNVDRDMYFIDVAIQATEAGEAGVVAENTIRTSPNFTHPQILDMTNPDGTQNGEDEETNEELYARLTTAWSNRALVSPRSINSVLHDRFSGIRHLTVVGAKDPYMRRDILPEIRPYVGDYHTYGRIDVYVMPYDHREVSQNYELDAGAACRIDEATIYRPLVYIKKIELLDINNVPLKEVPRHEYEVVVDDENYRFSVDEKMTIRLFNAFEYGNQTIKITYVTSPYIKDVQDYCNDDSIRNICTDILVKHYVPKVTSINVSYLTADVNDIDDTIIEAVTEHINSRESGEDVGLATFGPSILTSGATTYTTPLSVIVQTWHQNGVVTQQAIEDEIPCNRIEHLIAGDVTVERID